MKLTRKELKRLIEAFVVDEQGNTVHIDKWYADNTLPGGKILLPPLPLDHEYTDELIEKIDPLTLEDPKMARYIYDQYSKGDLESKKSAVEMAAAMGAITEKEADAAHTELDVKHHEDFLPVRRTAAKEGRKKFIDFVAELDAKRELFADHEDPNFKQGDELTHMDEVAEKFLEKYPNEDWPTMEDFRLAGIEFYWAQPYIYGYRYRKPVSSKPSTALVPISKSKPKPKSQPKPKKEKKPWWKFWENKNRGNIKITRKELRHLIESGAFIAGPDGRLRKLTGDPFTGEDTEHRIADDFIKKSLDKIVDPREKSMIAALYAGDLENKAQAIDLAASLIPPPDEESDEEPFDADREADDAHFNLNTALDPAFKGPGSIEDVAYIESFDFGLLKTYLNYLYRKGELVKGMSIYDIYAGFERIYPPTGYGVTGVDLRLAGIDFDDDEKVKSIDPEKFKL